MTRQTNMKYRHLNKKEEERAIIHILETLLDDSIPYSGAHRKRQWEKGWGENLKSGDPKPKYFGKYPIQRLNGRLITSKDKDFERDQLYTIVDSLAKKYLSRQEIVYEFGCGTGHNLRRIRSANPAAMLVGGDWAKSSNKIVESMGFVPMNLDFFKIPNDLKLNPNGGVYTVAALEQTGGKYRDFVRLLIRSKVNVVVNIEPVPEMLDPTKLLDYLSIRYMHKRGYLRGYLTYLEELEKKGKIKILEKRRSGIGSFLIDGYSIIAWKPI